MDEKIENITSTLDLDDSVRLLMQLTMLDCALCKDILQGRNIKNNIEILPLVSEMYYKIYEQIDGFIGNSFLADTLNKYRNTRDGYMKLVETLISNLYEKCI